MFSVKDNANPESMPVNKYTVRAADVAHDREIVLALWGQGFPEPESHPIKYNWCYGQTPHGEGRLYLLNSAQDGTIIGVQGIVPRLWWFNGKARAVGICADLVVDKNHRSIGPALSMVRSVIEMEQEQVKAELLYGFPNAKSEALYRRAGYTKLGELIRYARPLRLHHWLYRKGLPLPLAAILGAFADLVLQIRLILGTLSASQRWRCVPVAEFDSRFDELWSRVAPQAGPMVQRDSNYLRWRFTDNTFGHARTVVLETADGRIDGYVVYRIVQDGMVMIMDFLAVDTKRVLAVLLKLFIHEMYKQGHIGITLEFHGPKPVADCLIQSGFSPRESNPIYVVLNDSRSGLLQATPPYFTSSDRDQ